MHARARKRQKRAQLFISVRMRVLDAYVRLRARIIVKIKMLFDIYTDSLVSNFMKIRSLVAEKLLKQNCLCIFIIFKCIHVFLAH